MNLLIIQKIVLQLEQTIYNYDFSNEIIKLVNDFSKNKKMLENMLIHTMNF